MICKCGTKIPKERAKLYNYCIKCSKEKSYLGFMEYGYRESGELFIMKNTEYTEQIQVALKSNNRVVTS